MAQHTPMRVAPTVQGNAERERFRTNLHLATHYLGTRDKRAFIFDYVHTHEDESGIIYCTTRKEVEALQALLVDEGVRAVRYHAGLGEAERLTNQEAFADGRASIIVMTNSFGAGGDELSAHYAIHYNMPESIELYWQGASCAGRDGAPAESILLWNDTDISTNRFFFGRSKEGSALSGDAYELMQTARYTRLRAICVYCMTADCLHRCIARYFGEGENVPLHCGNCSNCDSGEQPLEVTELAFAVMRCVHEMRGSFGKAAIVDVLRGVRGMKLEEAGLCDLKSYGTVRAPALQLRVLIELMIARGYLVAGEGTDPIVGYGPYWKRMTESGFELHMKKIERPQH